MDEPVLNFERNLGSDGSHGIKFEWDMTLLTYLRCEEMHEDWKTNNDTGIKSFFVANNVKGVGAFDDIVIRVEQNEDQTTLIFAQCKHVEGDRKNSSKFQNYLGKKEIQKYFDSFIKVYKLLLDINSPLFYEISQVELTQTEYNLKELFNCECFDCEFVFFSNIASRPLDYIERNIKSRQNSEITAMIFSGQQNVENEYSLIPDKCLEFLSFNERFSDEGKNILISEFCKRFRLFLYQNDNLDILIDSAMTSCRGEKIKDIDNLRNAMLEETKLIFESNPKFSTVLNAKTDMLNKVTCFVELKKMSEDFLDSYQKKLNIIPNNVCEEFSNDSIKYKTRYPRYQKLKIYQSFIEINKKYLCLILGNEADINKFVFARETCVFNKEKKVYIFLENCLDFLKTEHENEFFVQIEKIRDCQTLGTPLVQQLFSDTLSAIKAYTICFQGHYMKLGDFCSNWKDVIDEHSLCDILESKLLAIGRTLPPKPSCYVTRRFKIQALNERMMKQLKQKIPAGSKKGFLIFPEPEKHINDFNSLIKVLETMKEAKQQFAELLEEKNDTFHFCMYVNDEIELLLKIGKVCNCVENKIVEEDYLALDSGNCKKVTMLTDVAGMGKSTSMVVLANKYKEMNQSHWVFFIELSKYVKVFETTTIIQDSIYAVKFIASLLLNLKGMVFDLFLDACNGVGNVALFFDGFDEISSKAERNLCMVLLALEETNVARIFISSRPKCVTVLEKAFFQQSIQFVKFSLKEEENCLMTIWTKMLENRNEGIDIEKLNDIVYKIIRSMQYEENLLSKILAIPFQIKMIANAYYETMLLILRQDLSVNDIQVDIVNLYENFINSYVKHFFTEKMKCKFEKFEKSKRERYIREKLRGSEELACSILWPKLLDCEIKYRSDIFSALFDDLGLITNEKPPIFLHRTIGEYLAAKYIVSDLFTQRNNGKLVRIIESVFVKDKYEVLRMFLNSLLCVDKLPIYFNSVKEFDANNCNLKNFPLHIAASEENITLFKALYERDNRLVHFSNENGQSVLHLACECGNIEAVRFILLTHPNCLVETSDKGNGSIVSHCAQSCLVNIVDSSGNNVFHYAAFNGKTEIIQLILKHIALSTTTSFSFKKSASNCDDASLLNMTNKYNLTPLHYAVLQNKVEAVELLMQLPECQINNFCCEDGFLLHKSAENGCIEIIEMLLQRNISMINLQNIYGDTPLHCAISFKNMDICKLLLQQRECLINVQNKDFETVLHVAAEKGCIEVIEILLQRDETLINAKNIDGVTPLYLASCSGQIDAVKLLLHKTDCSKKIRNKYNETALHVAASKGYSEIIHLILHYDGSLINMHNKNGLTPLHLASRSGKVDAAKALLQFNGCSTNLRNNDNQTALHMAAEKGYDIIVSLLLQYDISFINEQDSFKNTALHYACDNGNFKAVEVLITSECSLSELDVHGNTAFHIAVKKNDLKIIEILLQKDASFLNMKNNNGDTPLHLACSCGNIKGVEFLLSKDCKANLRNQENKTPLQCAPQIHSKEIERLHKDITRSTAQKNCSVS